MLACRYGNKRIGQTLWHRYLRFCHADFFGRTLPRQIETETQTPQGPGLDGRDFGQPAWLAGDFLLLKAEKEEET
jgi:hypothetical protein